MSSTPSFSCSARFLGRRALLGPLAELSHVVSDLRTEAAKRGSGGGHREPTDARCSLEISDQRLTLSLMQIGSSKRDEGFFESDDSDADKLVVKDHVLHSSGASSHEESGSDTDNDHKTLASSTSGASSQSASPTADMHMAKHSFTVGEETSFALNDVVICHTDKETLGATVVVWVVRVGSGPLTTLEAIAVDCADAVDAKELCRRYSESSKRSKLERHRRRKSDGGGGMVARGVEAIFKRKPAEKSQHHLHLQQQPQPQEMLKKASFAGDAQFSLVQHTDRNGVTHIEVEAQDKEITAGIAVRGPSRQDKSKFAKELENILSKELETRHHHSSNAKSSSSSSSATPQQLRNNANSGATARESLSLRQRAPALLLKKLDEFEEKAQRVWARAEETSVDESHNRKVWGRPQQHLVQPSRGAVRTPPTKRQQQMWRQQRQQPKQHQSEDSAAIKVKVRAPSPPPSALHSTSSVSHQHTEKQILVPTKTGKEPQKKLYPKETNPDILRAGAGVNGGRFLPQPPPPQLQFAAQQFSVQPHSLPIFPLQLAAAPVAWARYPIAAGGGAGAVSSGGSEHDQQLLQAQWAARAAQVAVANAAVLQQAAAAAAAAAAANNSNQGGAMGGGGGRGRSRDRSRIDLEVRRRAQSKSPARRPTSSLVELSSDISGFSRKFREFSDALKQKMHWKSSGGAATPTLHAVGTSSDASDGNGNLSSPAGLKSNLKKPPPQSPATNENNVDNKKVHFNKFATVQMME